MRQYERNAPENQASEASDDRFETALVVVFRGLGESAEPWKLLIGARPGIVRGCLEGAGYEIHDLELPVECDGWVAAWEVAQ